MASRFGACLVSLGAIRPGQDAMVAVGRGEIRFDPLSRGGDLVRGRRKSVVRSHGPRSVVIGISGVEFNRIARRRNQPRGVEANLRRHSSWAG